MSHCSSSQTLRTSSRKLRNNLFSSTASDHGSRLLTFKGEPIVWEQIRAVFVRDSSRPLRFTPLRQDHINLTTFTKNALAVSL